MSLKVIKFIYVILGSAFVAWVILSIKLDRRIDVVENWVAGQYGKYCYEENNMPNTITRPVYFESLDDCLNFINNK